MKGARKDAIAVELFQDEDQHRLNEIYIDDVSMEVVPRAQALAQLGDEVRAVAMSLSRISRVLHAVGETRQGVEVEYLERIFQDHYSIDMDGEFSISLYPVIGPADMETRTSIVALSRAQITE